MVTSEIDVLQKLHTRERVHNNARMLHTLGMAIPGLIAIKSLKAFAPCVSARAASYIRYFIIFAIN